MHSRVVVAAAGGQEHPGHLPAQQDRDLFLEETQSNFQGRYLPELPWEPLRSQPPAGPQDRQEVESKARCTLCPNPEGGGQGKEEGTQGQAWS